MSKRKQEQIEFGCPSSQTKQIQVRSRESENKLNPELRNKSK